ncbi:MAG: glycosyltransferase family 39 protein [Chitinophagaceae bacterium]|nr:glycosyltransferase family 39 protein [Chitinophagaceae bacterium]
MNKKAYQRKVFLLIGFISVLRLIIASVAELGNDESYYWTYSHFLQWNYFDHPPMVAIWIRIFTANLWLQNYVVFLRLGSIVGAALSTWFIFKCVSTLHSPRAGWFASCLYTASFYAGITAGLFIMPDSPQMVFWTFSLWMIVRITLDDENWQNWILFGIASGLCIMSKVHGVFIWFGFGTYILIYKKTWLLNPRLYVAVILSVLIFCPIIIWNIRHDFVTYRFHAERVVIHGLAINWYGFFKEVVSQLMINNIFNVLLILSGLFTWVKYPKGKSNALAVFNFIGMPLAIILLFISLFRETFPHWSGPAYISLIPLAAIRLADMNKDIFPKILRWSIAIYIIFLIGCPLLISFYPGTLGSKASSNMGYGDMSLDMYGWEKAGKKFDSLYHKEVNEGISPAATPVICYKWWGSHLQYYFCRPSGIQMIGLGSMNDLHQYMWMNEMNKDKVNFTNAYCIVPSDERYNVNEQYAAYYTKVDSIANFEILRGKLPSHSFSIYRLTGWKGEVPVEK